MSAYLVNCIGTHHFVDIIDDFSIELTTVVGVALLPCSCVYTCSPVLLQEDSDKLHINYSVIIDFFIHSLHSCFQ
jgi:hypothetical protein